MESDLATLLKSDAVEVEGKILLVMYYYHREYQEDSNGRKRGLKERNFHRCACRMDTKEGWDSLADSISSEDPAAPFTLDRLGIPSDMRLKGDRIWTRANAAKWLKMKTSGNKIHTLDEFLNGRKTTTGRKKGTRLPGAFETKTPYLRTYEHGGNEYELRSPYDFPVGEWMVSTRVAPPRKIPKVIKD